MQEEMHTILHIIYLLFHIYDWSWAILINNLPIADSPGFPSGLALKTI